MKVAYPDKAILFVQTPLLLEGGDDFVPDILRDNEAWIGFEIFLVIARRTVRAVTGVVGEKDVGVFRRLLAWNMPGGWMRFWMGAIQPGQPVLALIPLGRIDAHKRHVIEACDFHG